MGQKVNPHGARVGVILDWSTRWYANKKDFANLLEADWKLRGMLKKRLHAAGVSRIDIERSANRMTINLFTAKPGIVIGRGGAGVEQLKKDIEKFTGRAVSLNIMEIKSPDSDAQLVAENIAQQLEKRISFRRAMKQSLQRAMKSGAKGIKTMVSGRLGGADIARSEGYHEGSIPLQTLRANIDYGFCEAKTTYGRLGVKVWIYKGQVLPGAKRRGDQPRQELPPREERPRRESRPPRQDRRDRGDRANVQDRPDRANIQDRPDRASVQDRPDRANTQDRPDRTERVEGGAAHANA
ncbi:MAG: 30S ribosomal protein S3 [Oscillospiraceae bacterium]|jgi:small subunit ribosomal protein S3|nr:30S ribosomal protein S3 [Oscillospiraceae bacterium]